MEAQEELHSEQKQIAPSLQIKSEQFAPLLLEWFQKYKREFPWRPVKTPYQSAVAEILLQKTAAINAIPVYEKFIVVYPTIYDLVAANPTDLAELLRPLGIPRRTLLLQELAIEVTAKYEGYFPETEEELRTLPGLGPYGAGAVASQAFGQRAPMIDINVMRIFERVFSIPYSPRSGPSKRLREAVLEVMPRGDEASFNLALLDFGALICRKRDPRCVSCPLAELCNYNLARSADISSV
jgi:A/G-specific adenine glycosylase